MITKGLCHKISKSEETYEDAHMDLSPYHTALTILEGALNAAGIELSELPEKFEQDVQEAWMIGLGQIDVHSLTTA